MFGFPLHPTRLASQISFSLSLALRLRSAVLSSSLLGPSHPTTKPIPPPSVSLSQCWEGSWEAGRQAAQSPSGLAGSEKPVPTGRILIPQSSQAWEKFPFCVRGPVALASTPLELKFHPQIESLGPALHLNIHTKHIAPPQRMACVRWSDCASATLLSLSASGQSCLILPQGSPPPPHLRGGQGREGGRGKEGCRRVWHQQEPQV